MSNLDFDFGGRDDDNSKKRRRSPRVNEQVQQKIKSLRSGDDASSDESLTADEQAAKKERKRLLARAEQLKESIEEILEDCASKPGWGGLDEEKLNKLEDRVLIGAWESYPRPANDLIKARVQDYGDRFGCHKCGVKSATDPNQSWTADHCPPTELGPAALALLGVAGVQQLLFPQCKECSNRQAGWVTQFNRLASSNKSAEFKRSVVARMTPLEKALLSGQRTPAVGVNCLIAAGPIVSEADRSKIQIIGNTVSNGGCHTCGTNIPGAVYDADHVVPAGLVESGMAEIYEALEIELPALRFRPHCKKCSNTQGSRVLRVVMEAQQLARDLGLPSYRT